MTFFSPSRKRGITAGTSVEESTESQMERRDILRHLIKFARDNGATLCFESTVERPLIEGNRVTGLVVDAREYFADLVIDAAGMGSPVRRQLPERFGIVKEFRRDQYFTIYRAWYKTTGKPGAPNPFNVYFLPLGRTCIAWFANEGEYIDLLCGSFEATDHIYAEQIRQALRSRHPDMGDEIVRGGSAVDIPVRRPVSRMVADGYAAVGDAAGMTIPLNGSGISNSIRAGRLLAETVLAHKGFTAAGLWPYQVAYMRQIGAANATLDIFKRFMLTMPPSVIDFLFERRILEPVDLNRARTGQEITFTVPELMLRGLRGAANLPSMAKLASTFFASQKLKRIAMNIPTEYDEQKIAAWAEKYDAI